MARQQLMDRAAKSLSMNTKDQFYVKLIGETTEVANKQTKLFKDSNE